MRSRPGLMAPSRHLVPSSDRSLLWLLHPVDRSPLNEASSTIHARFTRRDVVPGSGERLLVFLCDPIATASDPPVAAGLRTTGIA